MIEHAVPLATLIFAAMAGLGSLVRIYQNFLMYQLHKRVHELESQGRHSESHQPGENGR